GGLQIAVAGGAAAEVGDAYDRARAIALQLNDLPELFTAIRGLSEHHQQAARLQLARDLARELLPIADALRQPVFQVDARHTYSMPLQYLGEIAAARRPLEEGIALYQPEYHKAYAALYHGIDPGVGCRYQATRVFWL